MTQKGLLLLYQFASIDWPEGARGSLKGLARMKLSRAEETLSDTSKWALWEIIRRPEMANLVLDGCVDRNDTTGFVACRIRESDGSMAYGVFRGSETALNDAGELVDWTDNFMGPLLCSRQYADVAAFARRFEGEPAIFTGHSKGGHNALYALAATENPLASAVAFNGQGFTRGQLTREQSARLRKRGRNYVVENDIVGPLLWHPEPRVFVQYSGQGIPHSITAFTFDEQGAPVPGHRPLWSYVLEAASRLMAVALRKQRDPCIPHEASA